MRAAVLLFSLTLMLTGACAPQRDYVSAGDTRGAMAALSPASLGRNLALSQIVTGELLGEGNLVRFELVVDRDQLVLVGLTPTGVPLFSIQQTGPDLSINYVLPEASSISPDFLIADIKFAYWPIETLNLALGPFRARVSEDEIGGVRQRVLRDEMGQVIVEAMYPSAVEQGNDLVLRRYDVPYRLRIQSVSSQGGAAL